MHEIDRYIQCKIRKTALFCIFQATGGSWRRTRPELKDSACMFRLHGGLQKVSWSFQFVTLNRRSFWDYMDGNAMCFRSDEEDLIIPGSVADLSAYLIPQKPGPDLEP